MNEPLPEAHVAAQIMTGLPPKELALMLRREGLDAHFGRSTHKGAWIWLRSADDFSCQLQPADPGEYLLRDGSGKRITLEGLARDLSSALVRMDIRHRIELYDRHHRMVGYHHHDWPLESG